MAKTPRQSRGWFRRAAGGAGRAASWVWTLGGRRTRSQAPAQVAIPPARRRRYHSGKRLVIGGVEPLLPEGETPTKIIIAGKGGAEVEVNISTVVRPGLIGASSAHLLEVERAIASAFKGGMLGSSADVNEIVRGVLKMRQNPKVMRSSPERIMQELDINRDQLAVARQVFEILKSEERRLGPDLEKRRQAAAQVRDFEAFRRLKKSQRVEVEMAAITNVAAGREIDAGSFKGSKRMRDEQARLANAWARSLKRQEENRQRAEAEKAKRAAAKKG